MKQSTVTAKVPANPKTGTPEMTGSININIPESAKEAIEMFGDEAVISNALAHWNTTLQSAIRSALRRGEPTESMQARLSSAKMGVAMRAPSIDPQQAYLAMFQSATPEKQAEMIKALQARAAKMGANKK